MTLSDSPGPSSLVWAMMEAVQATFEATGFVPLAILAGIMVFTTPLVAIASLNEDR